MKSNHLRTWLILGVVLILLMATAGSAIGASTKARVFVEFAPAQKNAVRNALQQAGAEFHYTFEDLNSFVVSVPAAALKGLSQNPNVVEIEADAPRYPIRAMAATSVFAPLADLADPDGDTVPYGVDAVQARDVWDANLLYHRYWLEDKNGAVYSDLVEPGFTGASDDLGESVDLVIGYYGDSSRTSWAAFDVVFRGGVFLPGDAYGDQADDVRHRVVLDLAKRF